MTNDELDVHAKAWQAAADVLFRAPFASAPDLLRAMANAVAEGYRQQKTPPTP